MKKPVSKELMDFKLRISGASVKQKIIDIKESTSMSANQVINSLLEEALIAHNEKNTITPQDIAEQLRVVHLRQNQEIKSSKKRHEELCIMLSTNQLLLSAIYNLLKEELKLSGSEQSKLVLMKLERGLFSMLPTDIEDEQNKQLGELLGSKEE